MSAETLIEILDKQKYEFENKNEITKITTNGNSWCGLFKKIFELLSSNKKIISIFVDGNVGSGKTTIIGVLNECLKESRTIILINEDVLSCSFFADYIRDKKTYGLQFQKWIIQHRLEQYNAAMSQIAEAPTDEKFIVLFDRSIVADINVFYKLMRNNHFIDDVQNVEYQNMLKGLRNTGLFDCDLVFYISARVETCQERILKRNRPGETYSREYLEELTRLHDHIFTDNNIMYHDKLFCVDGNCDLKQIKQSLNKFF